VDRLADDVGRQQEEADRGQLLRGPLGGGTNQAGSVARQVTVMDAMALVPLSGPNPSSATDPAAVAVPIAPRRWMPAQQSHDARACATWADLVVRSITASIKSAIPSNQLSNSRKVSISP
jgi:hypothetical protein